MNVFWVDTIKGWKGEDCDTSELEGSYASALGIAPNGDENAEQGNNVIAMAATEDTSTPEAEHDAKLDSLVLAHEWGHKVSLQHWPSSGDATMPERNFMCPGDSPGREISNPEQCEKNMYDNPVFYDFNNATRHNWFREPTP